MPYSRFRTEHQVRPDDIDMFQHVHNSRYFDYVLAARYEQMDRYYGQSMEWFLQSGYGWVVRVAHLEFKRPLGLGDGFAVTTWIEEFRKFGVVVNFELERLDDRKLACAGYFDWVLVDRSTGRPTELTAEMIAKYSI